jgi:DNA-binding winged helix-turn-helix (wHTH) protein
MTDSARIGRVAAIGAFELDLEAAELRRAGRLVALTGQPLRVLIRLVECAGDVVTREQLRQEIWGEETHVDFDAGLSTCINQIRTALGDRASSPRFVETVPRRGYRLIAPVRWRVPEAPARSNSRVVAAALAMIMAIVAAPTTIGGRQAAVTVAVFAVDQDPGTVHLQPVSAALTDALAGAIASAAGARVRVASPLATRDLQDQSMDAIHQAGVDYVALLTLRSLGGPVLVHVKLVGPRGWLEWTSDRTMTLDALERDPLLLAGEWSRSIINVLLHSETAG